MFKVHSPEKGSGFHFFNEKMKGQGSVEYLVIIAAVLVVSGLVVYLVTGSAGGSKQDILYSNCQAAAQQCKLLKAANANDICQVCEEQCIDPATGDELFSGSVACCQSGNASNIYVGSTGCSGSGGSGPSTHPCSGGTSSCPAYECWYPASCDNGLCNYAPIGAGANCDDGNECTTTKCDGNGGCLISSFNIGDSCNSGAGKCDDAGNCVDYSCGANDGNCPPTCDATNDGDCPSMALAGNDMTGPVTKANPLTGSCTDYITANPNDVWYTEDLESTLCGDYEYRTSQSTGTGVFIRKLTGVSTGVALDIDVDIISRYGTSSPYPDSSFDSNILVSSVQSTDLGDGNWVQCGAGFSHSNNGGYSTASYSRTCNNVISNTGDLYVAYTQSVTDNYANYISYAWLKEFDITYSTAIQLQGEALLSNGATSVTKYEWDFDNDGTYDWASDSSSMTSKYTKENPLTGTCNDYISDLHVLSVNGLESTLCGGYEYRTAQNTGTGEFIRKLTNVPIGTPLDVDIDIISSYGTSSPYPDSSFDSTVKVRTNPADSWVQCGAGFSHSNNGGYSTASYSRTCNNVISNTGDLYVAYTQSVTDNYANYISYAWLKEFNVTYQTHPAIQGWVTHNYVQGTHTAKLRITDNLGVTDTDDVQIEITAF